MERVPGTCFMASMGKLFSRTVLQRHRRAGDYVRRCLLVGAVQLSPCILLRIVVELARSIARASLATSGPSTALCVVAGPRWDQVSDG